MRKSDELWKLLQKVGAQHEALQRRYPELFKNRNDQDCESERWIGEDDPALLGKNISDRS